MPHWRLKAATQWTLSALPGGERLNHLLQRKVTRKYPRRPNAFALNLRIAVEHFAAFGRQGRKQPGEARFFEFGAGWDLLGPVALSRLGAGSQTVVDQRANASAFLVRDTLRRLSDAGPPFAGEPPAAGRGLATLLAPLAIEYLAPRDARATALPDGGFDCIVSTNTLEHIPIGHLPALLAELRRILAPDGIASLHIDYQDHYAYFDRRLAAFHFLSYTAVRWRLWNPPLHCQNRLRHDDWRQHFTRAGFIILEDRPDEPRHADIAVLRTQNIAFEFAGHDPERLAIPAGHWVLGRGTQKTSVQQTPLITTPRHSWRRRLWGRAWRGMLTVAAAILLLALLLRWVPPPITGLQFYRCAESLLHGRTPQLHKSWVALEKISPDLQLAAVASEDQHFIEHWGFDFEAIQKAAEFNRKHPKRTHGASTISQQTAKNVFLWPARSWLRKGLESGFTLLIEALWSKRRILEMYLNVAEFGDGLYGVEAASQKYFHKSALNLNRDEAALLIACLPNPRKWSPVAPQPIVKRRQAAILNAMDELGSPADLFTPAPAGSLKEAG